MRVRGVKGVRGVSRVSIKIHRFTLHHESHVLVLGVID